MSQPPQSAYHPITFPPLPSITEPKPSSSATSSPTASSSSPSSASDADDDDEDDYREVWLRVWNNSSDPRDASCRTAFDILWYCFSPAHQIRHVYQHGGATVCQRQRDDFKLCGKIKMGRLTEQEARVSHALTPHHTRDTARGRVAGDTS